MTVIVTCLSLHASVPMCLTVQVRFVLRAQSTRVRPCLDVLGPAPAENRLQPGVQMTPAGIFIIGLIGLASEWFGPACLYPFCTQQPVPGLMRHCNVPQHESGAPAPQPLVRATAAQPLSCAPPSLAVVRRAPPLHLAGFAA